MREDYGSSTPEDAAAYERERGEGLVPVICGAPVFHPLCWCVRPLHHDGKHACLHEVDTRR